MRRFNQHHGAHLLGKRLLFHFRRILGNEILNISHRDFFCRLSRGRIVEVAEV